MYKPWAQTAAANACNLPLPAAASYDPGRPRQVLLLRRELDLVRAAAVVLPPPLLQVLLLGRFLHARACLAQADMEEGVIGQ